LSNYLFKLFSLTGAWCTSFLQVISRFWKDLSTDTVIAALSRNPEVMDTGFPPEFTPHNDVGLE
jgi:hypothetical protein